MGKLVILGTGWMAKQLTLEAVELLKSGGRIILHTDRCGCAQWLKEQGIAYESLDDLYEQSEDFDEHVQQAVQRVMNAVEGGDVLYCVPDVRDRTAAALAMNAEGQASVIAGPPAEGALYALAVGQVRTIEASDWESCHLSARESCLIREIDTPQLASEIKLRLMEVYPEDSRIWVLSGDSQPQPMLLYELDRAHHYDHRTCALVNAQLDLVKLERYDFDHLNEIMRLLCAPDGCPWDRVQTHQTLRGCMLEEAYEVIDAIDDNDPDHLYDELGDMLMQIALHAEIARRHGEFDISDVTTAICGKMIKRHTHIFGSDKAGDSREVLGLWTKNKMAERGQTTRTQVLRDVSRTLPATLRSVKVLRRSAEIGFENTQITEVLDRLREILDHIDAPEDSEAVLGTALFLLMDAARLLQVDPEIALQRAAERFVDRFAAAERELAQNGLGFEELSPETLRKYWDLVKL